jgi:hypothetical protein
MDGTIFKIQIIENNEIYKILSMIQGKCVVGY